jgi:hypothetical protein
MLLNETPLVKFDSFALPVLVRNPSCFQEKKIRRRKEEREGARNESTDLPANWNGITQPWR